MLYVIDEIKPVIELIFKLYLEERYGFQKISEILNTKYKFPTPSEYYRMKHLERGRIYKHKVQESWTKDMVSNILKNEIYKPLSKFIKDKFGVKENPLEPKIK